MAWVKRARTIGGDPSLVWDVGADPHHLPRWWPGGGGVEEVPGERWPRVLRTKKGKPVRADFRLVSSDPTHRRTWEQELAGTPFERFLARSVIELRLEPDGAGTRVTIAQEQRLRGYSRTGSWMLRRATRRKLDEALDDLD